MTDRRSFLRALSIATGVLALEPTKTMVGWSRSLEGGLWYRQDDMLDLWIACSRHLAMDLASFKNMPVRQVELLFRGLG